MFYRELNWVFFKKKKEWVKRTENNGDNRETVNPSFILGHPLFHTIHTAYSRRSYVLKFHLCFYLTTKV